VKSDQDDNNPIDSLSPEAQMNIRMDKIAGECRIAHPFPLRTKAHSGNQVSLTLKGHIVTYNYVLLSQHLTLKGHIVTYNYVLLSQHPLYKTTSSENRIGTNISSRC
jgi:hypothetical protein